ncbi:hypothetical protein BDN71DRAFT_1450756 [Pleurotus eryngii]|uniref:Uncharacterized protein n=1 Tax=Pleurotus eryngii TaxID=5323 RepID=A0A9P6D552_PLEER|nr:hypothetical protein BDN71DRAFT_1450756 [Pleurotus eryngii]
MPGKRSWRFLKRSETSDPLLGLSPAAAAAHGSDTASPPFDAKRIISQEYSMDRPLVIRHTGTLGSMASRINAMPQPTPRVNLPVES